MSLSNSATITGKVHLGPLTPGPDELTIQEIEGKKRPVWDERTDEELIRRVRMKAQEKAKNLLARAMVEGEKLKQKAEQEGHEAGLARVEAEFSLKEQQMADTLAQTLQSLSRQTLDVWRLQRQDLLMLINMAVEKTLNLELSERRAEMLGSLLDQSLEHLEDTRSLVVTVAPADEESIGRLLELARERHPDLGNWRVKTDPSLEAGGLRVESGDGIVDNNVATRWEQVSAIFGALDLPLETQE